MDNINTYVEILINSLKKKIEVMDKIVAENEKQLNIINELGIDSEQMEITYDNKEKLIADLSELDNGFDNVYIRIRDAFSDESTKNKYKNEILIMKELITQITEKSVNIERMERRNQDAVAKNIAKEKSEISQAKSARKVANDYYNAMSKVNYVEPQFMDKKK